jgi:hypothetical protein
MGARCCAPLLLLAALLVGSPAFAGDLTVENFYTALLEPNRAADGTIPLEKQATILAVAAKILDADQMAELRARMARPAVVAQPVAGAEVIDSEATPHSPCEIAPAVQQPASPGLLDNLSIFAGLDGAKSPEDLGINANFGFRTHVNWAYPLMENRGIGVQAGTAINYSRTAVGVIKSINGTDDHTQSFTTVGLFQRTDAGLSWGVVQDFLVESYYQHYDLGQVRAQIGYALNEDHEFGVWATKGDFSDNGSVAGVDFHLRPISQANLYWRRIWPNEAVTRAWVGIADRHDQFILVLPGHRTLHHPVVFGADLFVPLTDRLALFGEANFITPNDTGTVTATLGFAWHFGGTAKHQARSPFAPLLPVANNPTFAVDLER